jgi:RNA polymerase sigma factor (sigma-70 family)
LSIVPQIIENIVTPLPAAAASEREFVAESSAIESTLSPGDWLSQVWQKHSPGLLLYARQKSFAAEDVVQTAFMNLARQTVRPSDPATWLYRVVRNGAASQWRQECRRQRREQRAAAEREEWFLPSPAAALEETELREALTKLTASERELIVLHIWGELTFAQLAEVLETSSSSAQRQYAAALARLKTVLVGNTPQ